VTSNDKLTQFGSSLAFSPRERDLTSSFDEGKYTAKSP
jgi:hypothetical protein